jgi:hypothetical protein
MSTPEAQTQNVGTLNRSIGRINLSVVRHSETKTGSLGNYRFRFQGNVVSMRNVFANTGLNVQKIILILWMQKIHQCVHNGTSQAHQYVLTCVGAGVHKWGLNIPVGPN